MKLKLGERKITQHIMGNMTDTVWLFAGKDLSSIFVCMEYAGFWGKSLVQHPTELSSQHQYHEFPGHYHALIMRLV